MPSRALAMLLFLPALLARPLPAHAQGFIPNRGQLEGEALFTAEAAGMEIELLRDGLRLRLHPARARTASPTTAHTIRMRFDRAAAPAAIEGRAPLETRRHFLRGDDPARWIRAVPAFTEVVYRELYPGIDAVIRLTRDGLQLTADRDEGPIGAVFTYEGADRISRAPDGIVRIETSAGDLIHDIRSGRIARAEAIDPSAPRDDPSALRWSGFLGGSLVEYGYAVASRPSGEVLVAGTVQSPDFPATTGAAFDTLAGSWDAFVAEVDASGETLLWATFLGGSAVDLVQAIALAADGDLLLTGKTESHDFPATAGAYDGDYAGGSDAFVTRLSSDGSNVVWSSFLGGEAYEIAFGLLDDGAAGVIVGGYTSSPRYPTTPGAFDESHNGAFDCFVTKLDAAGGSLVWSTLLGGWNEDRIYDIARGSSGEILLTAWTQSSDFPTTPGAYDRAYDGNGDGYIAALASDGRSLLWSTFLGGSLLERIYGIAVDSDGSPVVAGWTHSSLFPTTPGAFDTTYNGAGDGFVAKLDSTGSDLIWASFLGGGDEDKCLDVVLDADGNAILVGATGSADFPATPNSFDSSYNGNGDGFVAMLHSQGTALISGGFLGGGGWDTANALTSSPDAPAIALTGDTESADFPVSQDSFDESWNGQIDAFATRIMVPAPSDVPQSDSIARPFAPILSIAPNPFSSTVVISMDATASSLASPTIHDLGGRTVRALSETTARSRGSARLFTWDGTDDQGNRLPSGIYYVRWMAAASTSSRMIALLR